MLVSMLLKNTLSHLLPLLVFMSLPAFLHAEEPSSGTLIMISSIGGWLLCATLFVYLRRAHYMGKIDSK